MAFILNGLQRGTSATGRGLLFIWHWSLPYKSSNRPIDPVYRDIWRTPTEAEDIRDALSSSFPSIPREDLPIEEEAIRDWVRQHMPLPPPAPSTPESDGNEKSNLEYETKAAALEEKQCKLLLQPEETWSHVPDAIRNLLATLNAKYIEQKLEILVNEPYHVHSGRKTISRARRGISKTFRMWREGYANAGSSRERIGANLFILFCVFMACFPDIAAGFLHERSYNQRSIGSRIVTLSQLFSLWRFEFHTVWLLWNWSLERLFGALLGNTIYALTALVPAIHTAYPTEWFRFMVLGMSMTWQLGVQFAPAMRDSIVRVITRRQMRALRKCGDTEHVSWVVADKLIRAELVSHQAYAARSSASMQSRSWDQVPLKVRVERYVLFTRTYSLGRPADQLVGLLKEDMECILNTYEDYERSGRDEKSEAFDKGYAEPRGPKCILVGFDVAIFVYICYSFWPQKFTFNTVTCYGTVVCIKQAILACKRYQTAKGARRLFTNMVSINILGMFLVSTPVTVNRNILANDATFAGLTIAMVFAAIFLSEPIAPLVLFVVEGAAGLGARVKRQLHQARRVTASSDEASSTTACRSDVEKHEVAVASK